MRSPSKGDSGKTDADKQHETQMSHVLCNSPCKEDDRRGIIHVALRQAIVAAAEIGYGSRLRSRCGGAGGIRTLDRALQPYNGLANRRLQPLGHSSVRPICPTQGRAASGRFQSTEFPAIWTARAEAKQRNPRTGGRRSGPSISDGPGVKSAAAIRIRN